MTNDNRDLVGYGRCPPHSAWPGDARLAISFVLNYEEGAERTPLNGDLQSETYGGELPLAAKPDGVRSLSMESLFEYGSRAGVWRLFRVFEQYQTPLTLFAVGLALAQNPAVARYCADMNYEVAGHGWRWIDYGQVPVDLERRHIEQTVALIAQQTGKRPVGWYTGRRSANTRELLLQLGGFLYDSESYADDLPYYVYRDEKPHLVIPYTLDCNDFRYGSAPGFATGEDFYHYLRATFDQLYREGASRPKLMNIGLHARFSGRPGRTDSLRRFLDYISNYDNLWLCRREDIARHWWQCHPAPTESDGGMV